MVLDCSHHYCPRCGHHYGANTDPEGCIDCNPPRQLSGEFGFRYAKRRHPSWSEPNYDADRREWPGLTDWPDQPNPEGTDNG